MIGPNPQSWPCYPPSGSTYPTSLPNPPNLLPFTCHALIAWGGCSQRARVAPSGGFLLNMVSPALDPWAFFFRALALLSLGPTCWSSAYLKGFNPGFQLSPSSTPMQVSFNSVSWGLLAQPMNLAPQGLKPCFGFSLPGPRPFSLAETPPFTPQPWPTSLDSTYLVSALASFPAQSRSYNTEHPRHLNVWPANCPQSHNPLLRLN